MYCVSDNVLGARDREEVVIALIELEIQWRVQIIRLTGTPSAGQIALWADGRAI